MNYQKVLEKVGLSKNESAIYTTAVRLHTFSLAEIARHSGIKRTTCYSVVESLLQKNFIAKVPHEKTPRFIVVDPSAVLDRERDKMSDVEMAMKAMSQIRNTLKKTDIPHIELFYGPEGVKQIYKKILEDKPKQSFCIINPDYLEKYLGKEFVDDWVTKRVALKIVQHTLQHSTYDKTGKFADDSKKFRIVKTLPDTFQYETMYYIWNNKVGFISTRQEGISFIITSDDYARLHKAQFDFMWNIL